jgi:hypothetical protein
VAKDRIREGGTANIVQWQETLGMRDQADPQLDRKMDPADETGSGNTSSGIEGCAIFVSRPRATSGFRGLG